MYSIVAEESGLLPRERLLQKGAEVLSDQELLAIVLRTGTKSESVLSMANRILKGMTSLADLSRLSLNELQEIPGIGRVKSIELKAMVELAKRIEKAELSRSEQIMSSQQVARRMMLDIAARTAHKDMDVREMVYAMKELNNISDSGALVPGTVLKVPANKSDSPVRALDYMAQN